ncbi:YybH family protein [Denitromonas sp.]|uniref:YybH family protein n=1 Tax=Denitromonas sp. TaxID=2734609 RepID=UPI001D6C6168|nr:nuclear transport factor 2 family protein [Rhodocyclaceae bacterium]
MSAKEDVLKASQQFYAALNSMLNGDAAALADIWSHSAAVTTMHPVGGRQLGWDSVWASWAQVAQICTGGEVRLGEQIIEVAGDAAYELGVEQGTFELAGEQVSIEHRVTNIYRREGGGWKVVHHHTDISTPMLDVLGRMKPKQ